jgi:hypothetical protein
VVCWGGSNHLHEHDTPDGPFVDFRPGYAIRADGTIAAWGDNAWVPHEYRSTSFSKLVDAPCALDAEDHLVCFRSGIAEPVAAETFSDVKLRGLYCGRKLNGLVLCWSGPVGTSITPPNEPLSEITVGLDHACASRRSGEPVCWGQDASGQLDVPARKFSKLIAGDYRTCGLTPEGRLVCWGAGVTAEHELTGTYASVVIGGHMTCALRSDGTAECAGFL